jgi:ABC-type glycerol-3-phosphate transport system substrate-binding protein
MNEKGAPRGCRFTAASEDDKRFCTINVTLCANAATQDVAIELIFFNDSGGAGISAAEKAFYALYPDVKVRWQPKAWADESIMIDYITCGISAGRPSTRARWLWCSTITGASVPLGFVT